ncbi:MAG: hypothetical protein HKN91_10230 [Acidimicrobiia bacterium]|nr:hypothetical protein [Acidimicrobiia bacterium]
MKPVDTRKTLWLHRVRLFGFLYLSALLMVVASERIYWYWGGVTVDSILGLTLVYSIPAAAGLWALALTGGRQLHDVVLAGALFAFVVEGVVTPIIYADGPLPLFAAMFVGWHGLVAFLGAWYLVRKWLLGGRVRLLLATSGLTGLAWGAWARAAATAETLDAEEVAALLAEGIDTSVLTPGEFAIYAGLVGAIFMAGHWLVGYLWPQQWVPGRRSTRVVVLVAIGYMSLAVLPIVIWAPLKLAALVGGTVLLMKRTPTSTRPSIIAQLYGLVPLRRVLTLLPLPIAASASYWLVSVAAISENSLSGIYWSIVMTQVAGGALAYVWAARRALRKRIEWKTPTMDVIPSPEPNKRI